MKILYHEKLPDERGYLPNIICPDGSMEYEEGYHDALDDILNSLKEDGGK